MLKTAIANINTKLARELYVGFMKWSSVYETENLEKSLQYPVNFMYILALESSFLHPIIVGSSIK